MTLARKLLEKFRKVDELRGGGGAARRHPRRPDVGAVWGGQVSSMVREALDRNKYIDFDVVIETLIRLQGYTQDVTQGIFITPEGKIIGDEKPDAMEVHDGACYLAVREVYPDIEKPDIYYVGHGLCHKLINESGWVRLYINQDKGGGININPGRYLTQNQYELIRELISYACKSDRPVMLDTSHGSFFFQKGGYRPTDVLKEINPYIKP